MIWYEHLIKKLFGGLYVNITMVHNMFIEINFMMHKDAFILSKKKDAFICDQFIAAKSWYIHSYSVCKAHVLNYENEIKQLNQMVQYAP